MIKASLLAMAALTVLFATALRWRETRQPPAPRARPGLLARGKRGLDRWVTAAALATLVTVLTLGGLHWLRVIG